MEQPRQSTAARIAIDGGSRGNPGPASFAVILERDDSNPVEICEVIGTTTNNVAEYTALVKALELARQLSCQSLSIQSDSELLVKQMNGEYQVKSEELRPLYEQAQLLRRGFDQVTIKHVRRELNKRADQLCNMALDGQPKPWHSASATLVNPPRHDEQALELLRSIARPDTPAEQLKQIWQQLKTLALRRD